MPYYHVRITKRSRRTSDSLELDLTEDELMKRIVNPFLGGMPFLCGGEPIDPFDVEVIHINETEKLSSELIPEIRAERARSSFLVAISDEWYVTKKGRDVTRKFITAPPKKREEEPTEISTNQSKNIFIVHGRDHEPMEELKAMLKEFGLNPIVLHEQPSGSMTVVEKLEHYSEDIGFAFVLLTPDDALVPTIQTVLVNKKEGVVRPFYLYNTPPILRARQNVILEFGFFMARISRKKVCCLYKEGTELPYDLPSDMHGIVYIPFKNSVNESRDKIMKELKAAGYEIKL